MTEPHTSAPPGQPAPGWYPEPHGGPYARWWDGTQWTAAVRETGPRWRPLRGLARAVAALLVLNAFAQGALLLAFRSRVRIIDRVFDATADLDAVNDNDRLVVVATLVAVGIALPLVVLWLVWFHAAYRDAGTLRRVRYPKWAVWGWVVPIVSLFRPKQMVNDVWAAADERSDDYTVPRASALVQGWWFCWIAATVAAAAARGISSGRALTPDRQLERLQSAANAVSVGAAFGVGAAILGVVLVLRVTDRLERRHGTYL